MGGKRGNKGGGQKQQQDVCSMFNVMLGAYVRVLDHVLLPERTAAPTATAEGWSTRKPATGDAPQQRTSVPGTDIFSLSSLSYLLLFFSLVDGAQFLLE